ncbi:MAG: hypothetical protein QXP58_04920 [Thermoprotei archaeon]
MEKQPAETLEMQPLLDKTLKWLETQFNPEKLPFEAQLYTLHALKLGSRNIEANAKNLVERVKQDLTLKINVLVDLPRKDPDAFLYLYTLTLDCDPEFAKELRNTVVEDIRKLQLQDGSIIGEHVELAYIFYSLSSKDPMAQLALKHTAKLFEQKVLKNLDGYTPQQLYPYVKSLLQAELIAEQTRDTIMNNLFIKQRDDGGWGGTLDTLYAVRLLTMINTLIAGERIKRGLRYTQSKLREDGSLGDQKLTAIYAITHYEYMALGSSDQGFESNDILANTQAYTLSQLLVAAIRRAQTSLLGVNLHSTQLAEALLSALETTATLEATVVYTTTESIPPPFKKPSQKLKLRVTHIPLESFIVIDKRLIIFAPLNDDALSSPTCFAVRILDPVLSEKIVELLNRQATQQT